MSIAAPRPFSGRQFLTILVSAFLVVSAANGLMIWSALSSWSGLVSDSAYQEGLGFDRVLAESRAEAALGWKATIAYDRGRIAVQLSDSKGQPLAGMALSAGLQMLALFFPPVRLVLGQGGRALVRPARHRRAEGVRPDGVRDLVRQVAGQDAQIGEGGGATQPQLRRGRCRSQHGQHPAPFGRWLAQAGQDERERPGPHQE